MRCPCCKSENLRQVSYFGYQLTKKRDIKLLHCICCSHEFFDPLPNEDDLKRYYTTNYDHERWIGDVPMIEQKKETISIIKKFSKGKVLKVLDYGMGMGEFFRMLQEEGIDAYGMDQSTHIYK